MVLRWGTWGDLIAASILFPLLKEDGYHLTLHVTERGEQVIRHNPHIDRVIIYKDDTIAHKDLENYWNSLAKGYDKFINLSESVEGTLLKSEGRPEFKWSKERRHRECDVNYTDRTLEIGGYGHIKGKNGELYFSQFEHQLAKKLRAKYGGKFLILWALSGSSMHKAYPYTEFICKILFSKYSDIEIFFVGDMVCELLEYSHPQTKCYSGKWPIRKSLIMTKYADLIIGPETGVLNAASCFDTPKILFLSHSTHENLSKYWQNVTPLASYDTKCYPCHQLHFTLNSCELHPELGTPICMAQLDAKMVLDSIETVYQNWRQNNGTFHNQGRA